MGGGFYQMGVLLAILGKYSVALDGHANGPRRA